MNLTPDFLSHLITAAIAGVIAFFGLFLVRRDGVKVTENKIKTEQLEEELKDVEDTKKRREVRDSISDSVKRNWLRNYSKRN